MTESKPVAIPHSGSKPAWLEDDALVNWMRLGDRFDDFKPAATWNWTYPRGDYELFLSPDHWAAPVLRYNEQHGTNFLPWNSALQGEGPPKDYAGGKVMWGLGGISTAINANARDWRSIIGFEPAKQPAKEAVAIPHGKKHRWNRMDRPRECVECGFVEHDGSGIGYQSCPDFTEPAKQPAPPSPAEDEFTHHLAVRKASRPSPAEDVGELSAWEQVGYWKEKFRQIELEQADFSEKHLPRYQSALARVKELEAQTADLTARLESAREAIGKFGKHRPGCNVARALPYEIRSGTVTCTCGFDAALTALEPKPIAKDAGRG